ncbi:hypothetical protein AVEN_2025-1 [Araneus ventricosus]|uniref:Uncharacterized protein n=1 Tax=Araneus ventricosus TaxID=182803 RepID=A0A4Y2PS33_ARAVE|nr:hypothetical protein AVEN_2025-1 [Araneus ventricosus]
MICYKHEEKRRHTFNVVLTLHRLLVRHPEVRQITFAEEHLREDIETCSGRGKTMHSQSSSHSHCGLCSNTGCQAAILLNTSAMGSVYRLGLNTVVARTQERNT